MVVNTDELKNFVGVEADFDFDKISPHLIWAEETYIPDILGDAFYNQINDFIDDNSSVPEGKTEVFAALVTAINKVVCNIALFDWLAISGVNISDTGLHRLESGEIGGLVRKSAFQYQEKDVKDYFRRKGFNAMDELIKFILKNIATFTNFNLTDTYKSLSTEIIPNVRCFGKIYFIGDSNLIFMKIKPFIREAELFDIAPEIGNDFLKEIKTNLTDADTIAILPELSSAIVYFAIARAIETFGFNFIEDAARLIIKDSSGTTYNKAETANLQSIIQIHKKTASNYLGLFCTNVLAEIDKYPLFTDTRNTPLDITDAKIIPFF